MQHLRRFFWSGEAHNGTVLLTGSEARHISKVLRIEIGQSVVMCDGQCGDYQAVVEQIGNNGVKLRIGERTASENEPALNAALFLAYTKGEHLDFAVQKSVELGAGEIHLFTSERCVAAGSANKLERLNRIAMEAAKQSGRGKLVKVSDSGGFADALTKAGGLKLFCYEKENISIRAAAGELPEKISIMCGPEGGFTENEAALAAAAGWRSVSLGKRILRAETAPLAALAVLMYQAREI
ncbi:MAG: 16S rRNA (uracil(1498)-N(3))-methyltransferase [Oscillospiraceae bacterium]|nr:16S rRNA (uracil(1498)-N(3))-methyltransferase [Oscillospiraceae bacterium]